MLPVGLRSLFSFWILTLALSRADEWQYPRDLHGLTMLHFGGFESIKGFTGGLELALKPAVQPLMLSRSGLEPYKRQRPDGSSEFVGVLRPGGRMTVPVGDDIFFCDTVVHLGFKLKPLPNHLKDWGFAIAFVFEAGRHKEDYRSDGALLLLLRSRDRGGDDPHRDICLMPNDIEAAKQIIAMGGIVPETAERKEIGMILVGENRRDGANSSGAMQNCPETVTPRSRKELRPSKQ